MIHIGKNWDDELHDKIIAAVNEENGIRISALSRKLSGHIMTIKHRVILMSAMGELEIMRDPGSFRIYPGKPKKQDTELV